LKTCIALCLFASPPSLPYGPCPSIPLNVVDTVQPCDTTQARLDQAETLPEHSRVVCLYWGKFSDELLDRAKIFRGLSNMFSYLGLKFQVNWSSGRHHNTGQQRLYEFCYLLPFDLWTSYLVT
jgi:hypothetical protein